MYRKYILRENHYLIYIIKGTTPDFDELKVYNQKHNHNYLFNNPHYFNYFWE